MIQRESDKNDEQVREIVARIMRAVGSMAYPEPTLETIVGNLLAARSHEPAPHLIADDASQMEKSYAFNWLRGVALGTPLAVNDPDTKRLAAVALDEWHACKTKADAAPSSTRQTVDAVPVSEILSEIDHVQQNGIDVAKFGGQNVSEGRCRELCAMYLREFITSEGLRRKIVQMDAASLPATLTPDAKLEAAYAALRDACEYFTFEGQSTVGQRLFQYGKHAEVMKAVYGTSDGTAKP